MALELLVAQHAPFFILLYWETDGMYWEISGRFLGCDDAYPRYLTGVGFETLIGAIKF